MGALRRREGRLDAEHSDLPWHWNPVLRIASPPGIGAFVANTEYAHGGVSLQECVIPELIVERGEEASDGDQSPRSAGAGCGAAWP